jgi:glycosyltransferase involved in cell wall biosynthesis
MTLENNMNPNEGRHRDGMFENMSDYERGLEFVKVGNYHQALDYMQRHLQANGGDAQILNDTGAILHCLGRSDEAITYFIKARSIQGDSAEIVWNLAEAYLANGMAEQAERLFGDMEAMDILNVDILNRTANVYLNQGNKAGAIEMLTRSLKICPEQEILSPMVQVIRSKRPKIAFFCGGDGMTFLNDIYEFAQQRFEVRLFDGKTEEQLHELMQWSDISWFEWCTDLAVIGSKGPKQCENIIRLHRYEAYGPWPQQVNWQNVDVLITIGNSFVRDTLSRSVPGIENQTTIVTVPNGVNLDKFSFTEHPRGKNIAYLCNIRAVKNPAMVLQCMQKLHYLDPEYRLFFAGQFQDLAIEQYVRYMVDVLGLRGIVFFDGWQEDVCSWLRDKSYIVSTSLIESQGMGILEAMSCGLKPVIHNFPGAGEIFPSDYLFNIAEEFCDRILSASYEPQQYRRFVEKKYSQRDQLAKINNILVQIESKIDSNYSPVAANSGLQNMEPQKTGANVY